MKVVVLSSLAFSLINFRGRLLEAMRKAGHDVVAVAPDDDPKVRARLEQLGVQFRIVPMARTGTNLFADLNTIRAYAQLLREEAPDTVVAYTQKPIIYGGIACRIAGVKRRRPSMASSPIGSSEIVTSKSSGTRLRPLTSIIMA